MSESTTAEPPVLSARASTALLMLQLRAVQRQAAVAEAELERWQLDDAVAQLRAKLSPLVDRRQAALAAAMIQARADSEASVAAARAEAISIVERSRSAEPTVDDAEPTVDDADDVEDALTEDTVPEGVIEEPSLAMGEFVAAVLAVDELEARAQVVELEASDEQAVASTQVIDVEPSGDIQRADEPATVEPVGDAIDRVSVAIAGEQLDASNPETLARLVALRTLIDDLMGAPATTPDAIPAAPLTDAGPEAPKTLRATAGTLPITVTIDAESFSKAFSTAIAAMISDRPAAAPAAPPVQWMHDAPVAPKTSFWANSWHADVVLSVLAMLIVFVVLLAWST